MKDYNNLLTLKVNEVLDGRIDFCSLRIYSICYDYVHGGCKTKADYNFMVKFLFQQEDIRKELLK